MRTEQPAAADPKDATPEEIKPLRVSIDDLDTDWTLTLLEGRPFTGVAVEARADGSPIAETGYRNGLEMGWSRYYHPDGRLASEYRQEVFGPEGSAREWHPGGRLQSEALYELGVPLWEKGWDETGVLTRDRRLTEQDPRGARLQARRGAGTVPAG